MRSPRQVAGSDPSGPSVHPVSPPRVLVGAGLSLILLLSLVAGAIASRTPEADARAGGPPAIAGITSPSPDSDTRPPRSPRPGQGVTSAPAQTAPATRPARSPRPLSSPAAARSAAVAATTAAVASSLAAASAAVVASDAAASDTAVASGSAGVAASDTAASASAGLVASDGAEASAGVLASNAAVAASNGAAASAGVVASDAAVVASNAAASASAGVVASDAAMASASAAASPSPVAPSLSITYEYVLGTGTSAFYIVAVTGAGLEPGSQVIITRMLNDGTLIESLAFVDNNGNLEDRDDGQRCNEGQDSDASQFRADGRTAAGDPIEVTEPVPLC